ncbi:hypothetical protein C0U44_32495, partial [Klebsiella pneumoniae]
RAEADLAVALEENNIPFEYQLGEGAFTARKLNLPCIARKRIWRWRWKKITSHLNINWVKGRSRPEN